MAEHVDIVCPPLGLSKAERVECALDIIASWVYSEAMGELMESQGGVVPRRSDALSLANAVWRMTEFAKAWDFRNGKERFEMSSACLAHPDTVLECSSALGLCTSGENLVDWADYIVVCGGARYANLARPLAASRIARLLPGARVVGLAGMRPIAESERPFMPYALDAKTEFDALVAGMETAFGLQCFTDERVEGPVGSGLVATKRSFEYLCGGASDVSVLSTWSECSRERATSRDTFEMFLESGSYDVSRSSSIVLVTSDIYRPYQLLRFLDLAITHDLFVSAVGSGFIDGSPSVNEPASYLQEIKATLDAISSFLAWQQRL